MQLFALNTCANRPALTDKLKQKIDLSLPSPVSHTAGLEMLMLRRFFDDNTSQIIRPIDQMKCVHCRTVLQLIELIANGNAVCCQKRSTHGRTEDRQLHASKVRRLSLQQLSKYS